MSSSGGGGGAKVGCWVINHPQKKLARTEAYPFRAPVRIGSGPTFYTNSSHGRWDDLCSTASAQQQQAQEEQEGDAAAIAVSAATTTTSSDTTTHQSSSSTSLAAAAGFGMAVRLPAASFTSAQWQELEQQALIFKYMMASVPVPPHLLLPIKTSLISDHGNGINNPLECWGGLNARFGGGVDPEPGRCRRTDGKKWRCSRDVAPDQKYCERHMHRGRPRSRKPVEPAIVVQQQQQNRGMTASMLPQPNSPVISSSSSSFSGMKNPLQLVSSADDKTNRYMDWMRGENAMSVTASAAAQQWQLMQSKLGGFQDQRSHHQQFRSNSLSFVEYQDGLRLLSEPDHLREITGFLAGLEHQATAANTQPRQFIDAWSLESQWLPTTAAGNTNTKPGSTSKLPLSNLTLSMSGMRDEPEPVQADLGENESNAKPNWMMSAVSWQQQHCSPLGGPLAEALQCSNPVPASNNCSSKYLPGGVGLNLMRDGWSESSPQESPKVKAASPTRVLQRTLASFSDSSSGSSPTFSAPVEIALQWFNQCK